MADISKMRGYREKLVVATFLSGLNPELGTQIWGQILGAESIPSLQSAISKVSWISTAMSVVVPDESAMTAPSCGRD